MKRLFAFCILHFAFVATATAHEIGTTQVRATFKRDHTYVIDVMASPEMIAKRLHGDAIEKHLFVSFNGNRVAPHAEMRPNGIRLTGEIPPRADAFTWRYDLT